jgi:hypothetical protein
LLYGLGRLLALLGRLLHPDRPLLWRCLLTELLGWLLDPQWLLDPLRLLDPPWLLDLLGRLLHLAGLLRWWRLLSPSWLLGTLTLGSLSGGLGLLLCLLPGLGGHPHACLHPLAAGLDALLAHRLHFTQTFLADRLHLVDTLLGHLSGVLCCTLDAVDVGSECVLGEFEALVLKFITHLQAVQEKACSALLELHGLAYRELDGLLHSLLPVLECCLLKVYRLAHELVGLAHSRLLRCVSTLDPQTRR